MGAGDLNSDLVRLLTPPNDFLFTYLFSEKLVLNMLPTPALQLSVAQSV